MANKESNQFLKKMLIAGVHSLPVFPGIAQTFHIKDKLQGAKLKDQSMNFLAACYGILFPEMIKIGITGELIAKYKNKQVPDSPEKILSTLSENGAFISIYLILSALSAISAFALEDIPDIKN